MPRAKKPDAVTLADSGVVMDLGIVPLDLQRWDGSARGDLLAVYIWTDVRPLRGAAGLLDWRLSGKLSSLIQSGRLTGADGEQLMLPIGDRLPWSVAMVMGLGARSGFSAGRFCAAVGRVLTTVRGLGIHDIALGAPGRDVDAISPRRAVELLLAEARTAPHRDWLRRLTIIEAVGEQKDLADLIPVRPRPPRQAR
jgi:Cytosol aminopeptidase family, N-terminal domain